MAWVLTAIADNGTSFRISEADPVHSALCAKPRAWREALERALKHPVLLVHHGTHGSECVLQRGVAVEHPA